MLGRASFPIRALFYWLGLVVTSVALHDFYCTDLGEAAASRTDAEDFPERQKFGRVFFFLCHRCHYLISLFADPFPTERAGKLHSWQASPLETALVVKQRSNKERTPCLLCNLFASTVSCVGGRERERERWFQVLEHGLSKQLTWLLCLIPGEVHS